MNTKEILETLKDRPELYELIKGYTELKDQERKALILQIVKTKYMSRQVYEMTKALQDMLIGYNIHLIDINDKKTIKLNTKLWHQLKKYQSEVKENGTTKETKPK